jgi:hypothetical protein
VIFSCLGLGAMAPYERGPGGGDHFCYNTCRKVSESEPPDYYVVLNGEACARW